MDLYTNTQMLVKASSETMPIIARNSGVGYRWLHRYMQDDYKDVGVRRIQKLRKYLLRDDMAA